MDLHTLVRHLQLWQFNITENPSIESIENDHRKVKQGSLFICIKGYTVDGHDFAHLAVENGAVAVVAEQPLPLEVPVIVVKNTKRAMAILADAFYEQPSHKLHIIGITGTNGKTTTSHLIEKIMSDYEKKTGLIGTMYTKINDRIIETKNTTPESLVLQRTFKEMVDHNVETVAMEVSSHALAEGRVHGVDFDVAVFTNLTQDHLDYHQTMEHYHWAKGLLFSQLGSRYDVDRPKYAVINRDDPASETFIQGTSAHIITYAIDNDAMLVAKNIEYTAKGTVFQLISPFGTHKVELQLVGKFSVYNALASIGAALASEIPLEHIIQTLGRIAGVSGRFELVQGGQDFMVIVDYAHTPDSLENVLKTIQQFAKGKITVVVGCGGDRDKGKRPLMAQVACEYADRAIFTSDNPRSEEPRTIIQDMENGVPNKTYEVFVDRKEAIFAAIKGAAANDVVLIAGKGHETYQQIGGEILDFDDRKVALAAIRSDKNE